MGGGNYQLAGVSLLGSSLQGRMNYDQCVPLNVSPVVEESVGLK